MAISQTALTSSTAVDDTTVNVPSGHGIVVGNVVEISEGAYFVQAGVLSVTTTTITLDTPVGRVFPNGSPVEVSSKNMRVDGSTTPQIFAIKPNQFQAGDITRLFVNIQSSSGMDFSKFGSLSALPKGCVLRVKHSDGTYSNIFNWKSNGDFIERGFDHTFQEKVGGGLSGFLARCTFSGQGKRGVAIRLDGELFEELQVVVQDDISSGLSVFSMVAQGHELQ